MILSKLIRRDAFLPQRHEPAIQLAHHEDRLKCGLPVSPSVAAEFDALRRDSQPLPDWLSDALGMRLKHDFRQVRLHSGVKVDELAAEFHSAAFCVGHDIFLNCRYLATHDPAVTLDALCHELTHIANGVEPDLIRCWELEGHEELTELACAEFTAEFNELARIENVNLTAKEILKALKSASSNLDYRGRVNAPGNFLGTLRYIFGGQLLLSWVPIISILFAKGEGPRHGEGKNYTDPSIEGNTQLNIAEQDAEIAKAVKRFAFEQVVESPDMPPVSRSKLIKSGDTSWINHLGNALHTSQDRGAHREGRKNFGHCDPRVSIRPLSFIFKGGWSPDDPNLDDHNTHNGLDGRSWWICNKAAYNKAFNNSCTVLEKFLNAINLKPQVQWQRKSETCSSSGVLNDPAGVLPLFPRRPGAAAVKVLDTGLEEGYWHHGCVHGQPPGFIGRT